MTNNHSKGRAIALLPIAVFLLFFIGSGLITGDFYSMPAIVGFLIALIIAFLQNKNLSFVQKLRLASTGVGDENILTMCLIFLAAVPLCWICSAPWARDLSLTAHSFWLRQASRDLPPSPSSPTASIRC